MLAQVRTAGGLIEGIEVVPADLEDAFIDIMHSDSTAPRNLQVAA
jgi:ABC-2 type transport system ATP-binding protein